MRQGLGAAVPLWERNEGLAPTLSSFLAERAEAVGREGARATAPSCSRGCAHAQGAWEG